MVNAFELDDTLAAALGLRELKIKFALVVHRRFDLLHAPDLFEFALGLAGFGILGAEAIDKVHEAPDLALLMFESGQELFLVSFALFKVIVVIAPEANEFALANLDDAADELVEEFAVVGDDKDCARIALEIFLEPEQRFKVEMIGRFIEQQQIRLLRQKSG